MADSGLLMECEEEDLEPWQKVNDDVEEEEMGAEADKLNSGRAAPAEPSAVMPAYVPPPRSGDGRTVSVTMLPSTTASATPSFSLSSAASSPVPPMVSPGVAQLNAGQPLILAQAPTVLNQATVSQLLQTLQVASNPMVGVTSAVGQPYMVASQDAVPSPRPLRPPCPDLQNVGVNVKPAQSQLGILLNGQPVTLVPATQIIRPLANPNQIQAQPAGNTFKTVQIPATIAIHSSTPLAQPAAIATQTGQPTSPGFSQIAPKSKIDMNKGSLIVVKQDCSAPQKVANLLSCPPAVLQPLIHSMVRVDSSTVAAGSMAAPATVRPEKCLRCGAQFKMVEPLRGQICLCCPELRQSLQAMDSPRSAVKAPSAAVTTLTPPAKSPLYKTPSSGHSSTQSPQPWEEGRSAVVVSQGKLIMLVDDFYYGSDTGHPVEEDTAVPFTAVRLKCIICDKKLKNNIRLMTHLKYHVELEQQSGEVDTHTVCQHCYRHFSTPFRLQCHLENVHSQYKSTTKCKICEWAFESEPVFLQHMKNNHRPGEMPYVCQVCEYRSSFYADVYEHFCNAHKDTGYLLCPYCLRVFKTNSYFQHHFFRHHKKTIFHCDKCRLQFIMAKERMEHKTLHHKTFRKPRQLEGLKPGTKVTIRAYAVQGKDNPWPTGPAVPASSPKVERILKTPANQTNARQATSNRSGNSMVALMTKFQEQRRAQDKQKCLECKFDISSFPSHYPTYVSCSRCHYRTCCSRAYANHMINNHVPRKTTTKYLALYKDDVRLAQLTCTSCDFTTQVGDLMARHLVTHPDHCYSLCTLLDSSRAEVLQRSTQPAVINSLNTGPQNTAGKRPQVTAGILSSKTLPQRATYSKERPSSSRPPPKPTANCARDDTMSLSEETALLQNSSSAYDLDDEQEMGDELVAPEESVMDGIVEQGSGQARGAKLLTPQQMRIVLFALCAGMSQAANHFSTEPALIGSWLVAMKNEMAESGRSTSHSEVEAHLMEWVLTQREQQLPVSEENLLQKATEVHGKLGVICAPSYGWLVEFLLKYELGVNSTCTVERHVFRSSEWRLRSYLRFINRISKFQKTPLSDIGCVDELSIFVDPHLLAQPLPLGQAAAFRLAGTGRPLFDVVLTLLADGSLLPAMVFFRGRMPEELCAQLPKSVMLEAKAPGFPNKVALQLWLKRVWEKYMADDSRARGILIMDSYHGHSGSDFVASLQHANTLPAVVPQGFAGRLHPLEVCVGPVLREFLQRRWHQLVAQGKVTGAKPKDVLCHLLSWLAEAMARLGAVPAVLRSSFQLAAVFPKADSKERLGQMQERMVNVLQKALLSPKSPEQASSSFWEQEGSESPEAGKHEELLDVGEEYRPTPSEYLTGKDPKQRHSPLRQVFEKDSDVESFPGFEDSEMAVA